VHFGVGGRVLDSLKRHYVIPSLATIVQFSALVVLAIETLVG
jgi:hypothetical protein